MIHKTKKLFISYRSSDAAKVDKIARDLGLIQYDDGTPRYTTWQDKLNLPPASPHWWDAIVDAIDDCDVFVFHMSRESLQSVVCLAELDYAHNRNRPIIPVVLDGEFFLVSNSGKYNIAYWELVPEWLKDIQFIWYTGADFFGRFQQAIEMFERNWPRDVYAPRPLNPDNKSVHGSNHALYDAACDYAERLAFEDARKHFNALVRRNDKDYADVAAQWLELLGLYAELIEIDGVAVRVSSLIQNGRPIRRCSPKFFWMASLILKVFPHKNDLMRRRSNASLYPNLPARTQRT